jgi:hypothetical protein
MATQREQQLRRCLLSADNQPWANKARLDNPYQPAVSSVFFRNSNLIPRFDARSRW